MENLDTFEIFISAGFIALGGLTKGLIGLGMPLVSAPLLSYLMPVPTAISVMLMSMLFTNIYQMVHGGQLVPAFRRFWPLLITLIVGISVGAHLLSPHYSRLAADLSEASGIGRVDGGFRGGFSLRVGD